MIREQRFLNDGWKFDYGEHPEAELEPVNPQWCDVGLPHSFDPPDLRSAVGQGCYRRILEVEAMWLGQWIALEFLGVLQLCEVFVNGRLVGRHEGGYTPFAVDISDAVTSGANDVFVRVDDLWNARLAPRSGESGLAGGIHREVSLIVADRVRIDWHGVAVAAPEVSRERAVVAATVEVVNDEPRPVRVTVSGTVSDAARPVTSLAPVSRMIPARSRAVIELEGAITNPLLWHPDRPNLYRLTTALVAEGVARDSQKASFAVRRFGFTPPVPS
jgi:beta-galactosidase